MCFLVYFGIFILRSSFNLFSSLYQNKNYRWNRQIFENTKQPQTSYSKLWMQGPIIGPWSPCQNQSKYISKDWDFNSKIKKIKLLDNKFRKLTEVGTFSIIHLSYVSVSTSCNSNQPNTDVFKDKMASFRLEERILHQIPLSHWECLPQTTSPKNWFAYIILDAVIKWRMPLHSFRRRWIKKRIH